MSNFFCLYDTQNTIIKSLRLAWIPRLLKGGLHNWRMVPDHCFRSRGGLRFLLKCNYCVRFLDDLPKFYKDALKALSELINLYSEDSPAP